jgi:hypothetical protein
MASDQSKKDAAQFSDEELRASLQEGEDERYYLDAVNGPPVLGMWNAYAGPMLFMGGDDMFLFAQVEFMKRNDYPIFHTDAEIHAYAAAHGWPVKSRDLLGKKD